MTRAIAMEKKFIRIYFIVILYSLLYVSCSKSDFLNTRPDQSQVVPSTLEDFQALLDHDNTFNGGSSFGVTPNIGHIGTDDYWVTDANFDASYQYERNAYIWAKEIYSGTNSKDWSFPYRAVLYANIALDGIEEIPPKTL